MTDTKRPMPPLPNPLPPDFSILRHWCDWKGLNYERTLAANEARMAGRLQFDNSLLTNGHRCEDAKLSPTEAARQARLLKRQRLPIPCPFCSSLTREQQVSVLMELLADAIAELALGVVEGGES